MTLEFALETADLSELASTLSAFESFSHLGHYEQWTTPEDPETPRELVGKFLQVVFSQDVSQAIQDQVSSIISSYTPGSKIVRIHDYVTIPGSKLTDPPLLFDIGLAPLHKDKNNATINQGDILEITYYGEVDANGAHTVPVVKRSYEITYSAMSVHVIDKFEWYCRDGSLHPTSREIPIEYFGQRWLDWLEQKRSQIIKWLRYHVAAAMIYNLPFDGFDSISDVMIEGGIFFQEYGSQISSYIGGYSQAFPQAVQSDTRAWLDLPWPGSSLTIREKFQEQLVYT